MARALLVGCGCSGRAAGAELARRGWAVRGTSRTDAGCELIEGAGIEAALADPDRVGTILELVGDVTVVAWLLGSATGDDEQIGALHGPRLESLLEKLVDTPVRGFLYERAGSVPKGLLSGGADLVEHASRRWRIPVATVEEGRGEPASWTDAVAEAADRLIGVRG